eukprot:TRINITY_DN4478_c0_g1_i4.p1 TRINITY_DN4478_c0_g1~~TRINITY_DN4478_c0_g1_i4.p1  ORF type:complete len:134 (+),score=23.71 TRINITY_DN4478_c0_g1_i4:38-439(+)
MSQAASSATKYARHCLRLSHWGCKNRPFYHIVVAKKSFPNRHYIDPVEQVGTFDPLPNSNNEKLCALNLERLHHYIAGGITIEEPVAQLLGLAGFTPNHPSTYAQAWRNREALTDDSKRRKNVILKEIQEETN